MIQDVLKCGNRMKAWYDTITWDGMIGFTDEKVEVLCLIWQQ
jgi:hypothetical protein